MFTQHDICRCCYSLTLAGCKNKALVTHHHQCPAIAIKGPTKAQKIDVCATAHVSGLSRLAKKSVCWRSCRQSRYPPEIHITACAVPVPLCQSHRSFAIAPVESRLCHRALQLLLCPWLCHRACANVPCVPPRICVGVFFGGV